MSASEIILVSSPGSELSLWPTGSPWAMLTSDFDMNITITALKENDECHLSADVFIPDRKYCMTANPVTFSRRYLFGIDAGTPMLVLSLEEAKKMAEEILKL